MAMISMKAKIFSATLACLAGTGLPGSIKAQAEILQVDLVGNFTTPGGSVPFSGSFDVDTSVMPVLHPSDGGLTVTGYPDAAISDVSISAFGVSFSAADIVESIFVGGVPGSAVYFSEDLHPGTTPSLEMFFSKGVDSLLLGEISCNISGCSFNNELKFFSDEPPVPGTVDVFSVTTPVTPVPEPSTWGMLLVGFAGLALAGYWQTKDRVASTLN
jgi:PEP-CTERM motif